MKAMILAAGRGKRMQPLTDSTPKPLLKVGRHRLIEHHLYKLAAVGVTQVVINHAWLGQQLVETLGNGERYGVSITYSAEPEGGLETAGGIIKALPLLGDEPFWVINGDIFTEFPFASMPQQLPVAADAHLLLVSNPAHNATGDFSIQQQQLVAASEPTYTFSGMGLYHPRFFADYSAGTEAFVPLRPLIEKAMAAERVLATVIGQPWTDVGTPKRLHELQEVYGNVG